MILADTVGARLGRWVVSWEYPGYLEWSNPTKDYLVQATPNWDELEHADPWDSTRGGGGTIDLQATDYDGSILSGGPALPYSGELTREKYLRLVRPWLELPPEKWAQAQVGSSLFPRATRVKFERSDMKLEENPMSGGMTAVLVAAAFGLGWFLNSKKASAASSGCRVDSVVELNKWAATRGLGLLYFPNATVAPTVEELAAGPWNDAVTKLNEAYGADKVVTVVGETSPKFYRYQNGVAVLDQETTTAYCASKGTA